MRLQLAAEQHGAPLSRFRACVLRGCMISAAAFAVSRVTAVHDFGVVCPLRRLTGIPCPLCGSTSAFAELGSGDWSAGLAANPVTLGAVLALLTAPLGGAALWWRLPGRRRLWITVAGLAVAWAYQLVRFGTTT